jgi:hypothetical protein
VTTVLSGATLHHTFTPAGATAPVTESLTHPDDVTDLGGALFVGFQNGVGPQGEPSSSGNTSSTEVEFTPHGAVLGQWDITGKADGVTADPALGAVLATVNEDNNSALYVLRPARNPNAATVTAYTYSQPLAHNGGTDAITVSGRSVFISASAPGTTGAPAPQPTYPAVYSASLDPATRVATLTPLVFDESMATVVNVGSQHGQSIALALTDPDSNHLVPFFAPRFGGDFMLTSQGDLQQVYVSGAGTPHQQLSVLNLSQSVDDTAWTAGPGTLFASDSANDVDAITGEFPWGRPIVAATPCGSNSAPATCPALGFPANFLGTLDPWTGQVTALNLDGALFTPQGGLDWVSALSW